MAIRAYNKSLKKFKKTKSIDDYITLKKYRVQVKCITKISKTESWQKKQIQ